MQPRIGPHPSEVAFIPSAPRPTPTPANIRFAEVLARNAGSLARSAEAAIRSLPGAPIVALALRGPGGSTTPGVGLSPRGLPLPGVPGLGGAAAPVTNNAPEGPGGGSASPTASGGDAGMESSLAQTQEMNLYYLRIQEEMNAQNRTYSALSNVLKAQHETVKNAISNIR